MKETEEIYDDMKNEIERRTGTTINSGGEMALRLYAVAAELCTLWAQVDWTRAQSFPQTASGDTLDLHAAARGLSRAAATAPSHPTASSPVASPSAALASFSSITATGITTAPSKTTRPAPPKKLTKASPL